MRKILIVVFVVFVTAFIACASKNIAEAQISSNKVAVENCGNLKFHFLVTENVMYSSNVRHIEVFLDETAFSEENLTKMFKYLSAQNSDAKILGIEVKTNWQQFSFPDDCLNGTGISEQPLDPNRNNFHQAIYHRSNNREYFKYNPVLKTDDYKTVNLIDDSPYAINFGDFENLVNH